MVPTSWKIFQTALVVKNELINEGFNNMDQHITPSLEKLNAHDGNCENT